MNPQAIASATTQYAKTTQHLGQTALALYNASIPGLEIFAVIATAALIAGTIIIIVKTGWFSLRVDRVRDVVLKTDMPKKHASAAWTMVEKHFFAGDLNDLKVAIMDADSILNDALRYAGIHGVNLGERLKHVKRNQMPNLEDVWAAHKLRNEIAHETNLSLKRDLVEKALDAYKVALKNLGIFDEDSK